jgi:hypothetical protein
MASTGIGASLLALVSLPTFMKDFIDTYARSNFASRFLAEALMSMAQHGTPTPNQCPRWNLTPHAHAHAPRDTQRPR